MCQREFSSGGTQTRLTRNSNSSKFRARNAINWIRRSLNEFSTFYLFLCLPLCSFPTPVELLLSSFHVACTIGYYWIELIEIVVNLSFGKLWKIIYCDQFLMNLLKPCECIRSHENIRYLVHFHLLE